MIPDDANKQFKETARGLPFQHADSDEIDERLRIRVESPDGVFLIYDITIREADQREKGRYVAYWGDKLEESIYLYDRLLVDSIDAGHALVNLDRDLLIDVTALAASHPWLQEAFLDALAAPADPAEWIRPGQLGIADREGFIFSTDGSDGGPAAGHDGAELLPCPVSQQFCIMELNGTIQCFCMASRCMIVHCGSPDPCTGNTCDDGLFCNGTETCLSINGACWPGVVPCDPGYCNEAENRCNECISSPECDDELFCSGIETCNDGICTPGVPPCPPPETCNETAGRCNDCNSPADCDDCADSLQCDDNLYCNGSETCSGGTCVPGLDPCPGQVCDEGLEQCVECLGSGSCNDDDPCTVQDKCENGNCKGRTKDCADGIECTTDQCDPDTGQCSNTETTGPCDDGNPCTASDTCVSGDCVGTDNPDCACPYSYAVSNSGYTANETHSATTRLAIEQGTEFVRVRAYFFSCEYPRYTGEQSIFNDVLSYTLSYPSGSIGSGTDTVNSLHGSFGSGPFPCGNVLVLEKLLDFSALTVNEDSWIESSASATNIGDGAVHSGVGFKIDCDVVGLEYEGVADEVEYSIGGLVALNNDDDNNNGVPDLEEQGLEVDLGILNLTRPQDVEGTVTLSAPFGGTRIKLWTTSLRSGAPIILPETWDVAEMPASLWVEGVGVSNNARDIELKLKFNGVSGTAEDRIKLTVVQFDLAIDNGGSDLDNGDEAGSQGLLVPEADEETVGAFILVNWDDDDGDGAMNADGSWSSDPIPDLYETSVQNEDNLAKLVPTVDPLPEEGVVELRVPLGGSKIKLWTTSTKQTELVLIGSAKRWDLSDPVQRSDFQQLSTNGLWIEGVETSDAVAATVIRLYLEDAQGQLLFTDTVRATVVMINLANAVYRDNQLWSQGSRGHSALVWKFVGPLTTANLEDDGKFLIIEIAGPTDDKALTTMTQAGETVYGCFTNPIITYVQRLKVLQAAKSLVGSNFGYPAFGGNVVEPTQGDPNTWDGKLNTIGKMRCDGLVEVCYEINGIEVWGMLRAPDGVVHYDITDQSDQWDYNALTGNWTQESNQEPDNLEEHNDFDSDPIFETWDDTLMPATQCGHVTPRDSATRFRKQDLCIPVGSKGGN